jgi:glycerol-3-phosphate acyltransferase PlsY
MLDPKPLFLGVLLPVLGYLSGSLPFAIWITRAFKGVDVRQAGSGHATTTNTIRQAGFGAGVIVFLLDFSKGFVPTWLATRFAPAAWIIPLTAALAVIGHCWPVFSNFRGGMGLATTGGSLMAIQPLGFIISLGVLISLTLILHHSARASVFTGLLMTPVMFLLGLHGMILWVGMTIGLVISIRFLSDWKRKYRELWLDREISQ